MPLPATTQRFLNAMDLRGEVHMLAQQLCASPRTFPVTTPGLKPLYLLYSSKNQAISRAPVFMSGAGMSSLGPMISFIACVAAQHYMT
jgi:hypothetical protein